MTIFNWIRYININLKTIFTINFIPTERLSPVRRVSPVRQTEGLEQRLFQFGDNFKLKNGQTRTDTKDPDPDDSSRDSSRSRSSSSSSSSSSSFDLTLAGIEPTSTRKRAKSPAKTMLVTSRKMCKTYSETKETFTYDKATYALASSQTNPKAH